MAGSSSLFAMLVYLFLLLVYLPTGDSQSVAQCHKDERLALLELKQSLEEGYEYCFDHFLLLGDYKKLESWKLEEGPEGANSCNWTGVQCDTSSGHVIGLDLENACLYGSINSNSSLFRLVHLETLKLSFNNFSFSPVPPEIGTLSRLTTLEMAANVLTGEIPSSLINLTRLSVLDLSVNQLTGQIPSFLGNIHQLSELFLDKNMLTGQIPNSFGNLSKLCRLHMSENQFTGEIPSFLWTLTNLSRLGLSNNLLTGPIPASLGNLTQLSELDLSVNQLTDQIPPSFGNLTRLSVLDLRYNQLSGPIPDSLMNLQLTDLRLSSNNLTGPLPAQLGSLVHLENLFLSGNRFHGPIPSSVSHLINLTYLDISANNLEGGVRLSMFSGLKSLNTLVLSFNRFYLVPEPEVEESYPVLWTLGLGSCNLHGFPEFLRAQSDLTYLDLSYNNISGEIPGWFSNFVYIRALNLSGNALTGLPRQPAVFGTWKQVGWLDLRLNQLQGPLPEVAAATLQFYFVSDNRLSGAIPSTICSMRNMKVLDLAKNNLSGVIPQCLSNLSRTLTVLNLHNNRFDGTIPEVNRSSCSLRMIDFSSNQLEGPLPRSLADCNQLEFLNIGDNKIGDTFPSWLGSLPFLRVLILRSNRLHGSVLKPAGNKSEFPALQIVDLSHNSFVGSLPSNYFRGWKAMRVLNASGASYLGESETMYLTLTQLSGVTGDYDFSMTIINKGMVMVYAKILEYLTVIDLSSNNFTGEIPESVGSLEGLHLLNLSNNLLTGHIPTALDGLTNLEALDLSRNKLSGEIPRQLTELTSLSFFSASYNQLSGPIPRGRQFDTFDSSSYKGNPGLCEDPLSKKCGPGTVSPPPPPIDDHEDSKFEFSWKIILMGFASGIVIGVVLGQGVTIRRDNRFVKKFGPRYWRRRA